MKNTVLRYSFVVLLLAGTPLLAQKQVQDFTLTDIDGNTYGLYDELGKGNAVILDFFRYYCHSCQESSPAVEELWQDYRESNVWIWKIDIYDHETEEQVRDFKKKFGGSMPSFLKGNSLFRYFVQEFGLQSATPGFIIILPDKTVAWARAGFSDGGMRSVLSENGFSESISSVANINAVAGMSATLAPNPAADNTQLQITLQQPGLVRVHLYDGIGRETATILPQSKLEAGQISLPIDTGDLRAGVYFIRIEKDGQSTTQTLTIVK